MNLTPTCIIRINDVLWVLGCLPQNLKDIKSAFLRVLSGSHYIGGYWFYLFLTVVEHVNDRINFETLSSGRP